MDHVVVLGSFFTVEEEGENTKNMMMEIEEGVVWSFVGEVIEIESACEKSVRRVKSSYMVSGDPVGFWRELTLGKCGELVGWLTGQSR